MSSQPAGSGDPQRSWRPGASRKSRKSARKVQLAVGLTLLAAIIGGITYLLWAPKTGGIPPLTYIGVGRTNYGASDLPPNAGAREDVLALDELFKQIAANDVGEKVRWAGDTRESLVKSKLPGVLKEALKAPGNLFVFCSLHSEVVAETDDQGEHAELQLLLDGDTGAESRITLHQLIMALDTKAAPGKKVVLALDATTAPAWTRGILSARLEDLVSSDMAHLPKGMTVVLATSGLEQSWNLPAARETVDGWQNQPGTVFGNAFYQAFASEAAAGPDGVLQLGELLEYVKQASAKWKQTVTWYPSSVPTSLSLMAVSDVPPPDSEPNETSKSTPDGPEDAEPPATAKSNGPADEKQPLSFEERLQRLWKDRDQLTRTANLQPATWSQLNRDLIRIEQTLLFDLHNWQSDTRAGTHRRLDQALTDSERQFAELLTERQEVGENLPLVDWHPTPTEPSKETRKLFEEVLAAAQTGEIAAPSDALATPAARAQLAQELVRQVRDTNVPIDEYGSLWNQKVGPALRILADSKSAGLYWRTSQWPAELVFLSVVAKEMDAARLQLSASPWNDSANLLVLRNLLIAQGQSNRLGVLLDRSYLRPEIQRTVQAKVEEHQAAMLAAEQWLFAGDFSRAKAWTKQATDALEEATRRGELVRSLLSLRDTLNLRLEGHARWIASRQEYQGLNVAEMRAAGTLLQLFPRLQEVERAMGDGQADTRSLVKDTAGLLARLDEEIGTLVTTVATTPTSWTQIPGLLRYPWLTAEQRTELIGAFAKRSTGGDVRKNDGWQAFWCAKTLNPDEVDAASFNKPEDGLAIAVASKDFRSRWAERKATADNASEAETAAARARLLTRLRTQIAKMWVRRNKPRLSNGDRDTTFSKPFRSASVGIPKGEIDAEQPAAALELAVGNKANPRPLSGVVRTDKTAKKQIRVRWEPRADNQTRNIVLKSDGAKWADQPTPVRQAQNGQLLILELQEPRNCEVILALADVKDRALSFQRFILGPEFDSSGWHIRFTDSKTSKPLTQYVTSRGQQQIDEPWINPGVASATRLLLERPADGPVDTMTVQLLVNGEPTGLGSEVEFKSDTKTVTLPDGRQVERVPLLLTPAKGQPSLPKPIDITDGMVFRLTSKLEPDQSFDLHVEPWIRGPKALMAQDEPICRVEGDSTVRMQLERRIEPGTLPTELPVKILIGQKLRQTLLPKTRSYVTPGKLIDATSDPYRLNFSKIPVGGEVTVSVAEIPAYIWRMTRNGLVRLNSSGRESNVAASVAAEPTVRITSPTDGLILTDRSNCPELAVQLLADYEAYRNTKANLRVQLKIEGKGTQHTWSALRGPIRRTTLSVDGDKVVLLGEVKPMEFKIGPKLEEGKQTLTTVLQRVREDGTATDIDRKEIRVTVDSSKPKLVWKPSGNKVSPGEPLKLPFLLSDPETGIDQQSAFVHVTGPAGFDERVSVAGKDFIRITASSSTFPQSGKYQLQLEARNKAGIAGVSGKKSITINLPQKNQSTEDK